MPARRKFTSPLPASVGGASLRQEHDMSFRFSPLAAALALGGVTTPVMGQSADGRAPTALALTAESAPVPGPAALKPAYHLSLTSTWPQQVVAAGCRNGGEETLEGTLALEPDGTYAGRFTRRTRLLFCGAHGPAAAGCSLTLEGKGAVAM